KEEFEKANNVTIEILGLEGGDLKQKISLDARNKKGAYDLIMADDPWMPEFAEAGIFVNLSDIGVQADSDFVEASLKLGKFPYGTGSLYALPFAGNVQLFFYNKGIFEENGFSVPTSWEEVLETASKINTMDGKVGYVIRGQQGNPIVSDFLPVFWAFGGKVFDKNWNATVNSEAGKKALKMYIDLLASGANYEKADIVSSVSSGKSGMSLGWPSWYISGENANAEYAPIPFKGLANGPQESTGMIGNWMMGVTNNSQNKELAGKFLSFITSSKTQKLMVKHGGVPTRKSVYLDETLKAQYQHFPTQLNALENSVARPRTPKWSEVETAFGAELSAAITGTKSIEEALNDAKITIDKIMN
ncbi:MAG: extracellular solute-binding protein, partial [Spirochaetes bacterium]|nr:extracellular solute-binding protein [Spirochaetota bacterium]